MASLTSKAMQSAASPRAIVLLFLLQVVDAAAGASPAPAAAGGSEAVTRVVNLLTELKGRIETDGQLEQEVYDKYACWCEAITAKKAAAITTGRDQLTSTGNTILQLKGTVAVKLSEINQLVSEIKENEEAQNQLTVVRQKESAAFETERQELTEAISALEKAVKVLVDATSLLDARGGVAKQVASDRVSVAAAAAAAVESAQVAALRLPSAEARQGAQSKLAVLAEAVKTSSSRYAPQSATIQGILKDMYQSFSTTLETRTHQEHAAARAYEDLMATYQASLKTMQADLTRKEKTKAEAETMLADATQAYQDLEAQIQVDVEFFDSTKAACVSKANEWSTRSSMRAEELRGIEEALSILTSDDARALFGTAITPGVGLLQIDATLGNSSKLGRAVTELRMGAKRSGSLRLASLAASLSDSVASRKSGHFDAVMQAIDTLVQTLKDEEALDNTRADNCKSQLHSNALAQENLTWEIEKNTAEIEKLGTVIAGLQDDLNTTVVELDAMRQEIADMSSQRIAANQAFTQSKADDLQAIQLLQQAIAALSSYYQNHSIELGTMFAQGAQPAPSPAAISDVPPEATFSSGGKRGLESKGVLQLLNMIVEDLQAEIDGSVKSEAQAQLDYERSMAAANATAEALVNRKTNLDGAIALHQQKEQEESDLKDDNEADLLGEQQTEASLKPSCDWIAANLEPRREKRAMEMEALKNAKEYLAGALPSALVQTARRKISRHSLRGA